MSSQVLDQRDLKKLAEVISSSLDGRGAALAFSWKFFTLHEIYTYISKYTFNCELNIVLKLRPK